MEADEKMILKDMPVDTRNYSIIDNVTGKPIDQDNYTLTIDPEVISKLNQLKKMNEEKIKQAALKDEYQGSSYVNTFTPEKAMECGTLFPELSLSMCEYLNGVKEDKCNGC